MTAETAFLIINTSLSALLTAFVVRQWIMLRRLAQLDNLLRVLVTRAFGAQISGLPVWEAWLDVMGDIEVHVVTKRYGWDVGIPVRRNR